MIKIIGLQYKKKYETDQDMDSLRYGKIMIMADQVNYTRAFVQKQTDHLKDQDGSHIKGLVINFVHANWPSLLKRNFVEEFITPIVKVTSKGGKDVRCFYSIPEYAEWRATTPNWKTWKIKYYKGNLTFKVNILIFRVGYIHFQRGQGVLLEHASPSHSLQAQG